jgi:hypothetical protein
MNKGSKSPRAFSGAVMLQKDTSYPYNLLSWREAFEQEMHFWSQHKNCPSVNPYLPWPENAESLIL